MPFRRTVNGKIVHTDFTAGLPSWLDDYTAAAGSISVAGGVCTIYRHGATDLATAYYTNPLPATFVTRVRAKPTSLYGIEYNVPDNIIQAATCPTTITPGSAYTRLWASHHALWGTGHQIAIKENDNDTHATVGGSGYGLANWQIYEKVLLTSPVVNRVRDADYTVDYQDGIAIGAGANDFKNDGNPYWLMLGYPSNDNFISTEYDIDFVQVFKCFDVLVKGLDANYAVRLYDEDGNIMASAAESGGTATLDVELIEFPFTGFLRVFTDDTYLVPLSTSDVFYDLFGGDEYTYYTRATTLPGTSSESSTAADKAKTWIKIFDRSGAKLLSKPDNFEGLTIDTCNPGGFTTAKFTVHKSVSDWQEDMQAFNHVQVGEGAFTTWEGYIAPAVRSIKPDTFDVNCLGWSARLNETGTEDDITAPGGGYQANEYITDVMLDDDALELVAGDIDTNDYTYPNGCIFEFAEFTPHFDAIEQLNACNLYDWFVWEDKKFYWQPQKSVVDWYVCVDDCGGDLKISENTEGFCNYVYVYYTQDGVHYQVVEDEDTDSQETYGRIVKKIISLPGRIVTAAAEQRAAEYIEDCATMKAAAEFTTRGVYDSRGAEHHLAEVRAGDVVCLTPWQPTEELLSSGVDNIAKFRIKSTSYDNDSYTLAIVPNEFLPRIEIYIARLQTVGY